MTEKKTDFDPKNVETATIEIGTSYFHRLQSCMLCENTRKVPPGYGSYPWICDECREAIAFLKKLKSEHDNFDPLKPILD